ncbi:hypothetical protein HNQ34_000795 [Anoxybacillus tepidamans]|uniref:Uncharacterized protein n=1 Tax=Anoxybacteroides tepidamans TaxID=265948 RepID=A0A7W8INE7_9BACL|nr:hypothetical protein [Anoxybacillus tepidamans]MBB5323703.1 hypothetical protein [Anoxybacillus tepidamans]
MYEKPFCTQEPCDFSRREIQKISIDSHTVIRSSTGKQLKPEEIAAGVSVTVKTRKPLSAYKSGAVVEADEIVVERQ